MCLAHLRSVKIRCTEFPITPIAKKMMAIVLSVSVMLVSLKMFSDFVTKVRERDVYVKTFSKDSH